MARQTAFPGVIVERIDARSGGGGRALKFEEGLPEDIPPSRIQSLIDQVPLFGSDAANSLLLYHLQVAAYTELAARGKTIAFVRAKNPFSTSRIEVAEADKIDDLGVLKAGRNSYRTIAIVEK